MTDYHEPPQELSSETRDLVRALNSLREEIEAIDWYQQRVDVSDNESLRSVLAHNRDEEIEHACMTLEWLRRNMDGWDEHLRQILFSEEEITDLEPEKEGGSEEATIVFSGSRDLGIGKI
ncbi:MAG TPA: ferritin-like domain-containing protein [bacterium]|nr:ferritin-like domain-containing protein [bacterium]